MKYNATFVVLVFNIHGINGMHISRDGHGNIKYNVSKLHISVYT